jgi:hypothetical protein
VKDFDEYVSHILSGKVPPSGWTGGPQAICAAIGQLNERLTKLEAKPKPEAADWPKISVENAKRLGLTWQQIEDALSLHSKGFFGDAIRRELGFEEEP